MLILHTNGSIVESIYVGAARSIMESIASSIPLALRPMAIHGFQLNSIIVEGHPALIIAHRFFAGKASLRQSPPQGWFDSYKNELTAGANYWNYDKHVKFVDHRFARLFISFISLLLLRGPHRRIFLHFIFMSRRRQHEEKSTTRAEQGKFMIRNGWLSQVSQLEFSGVSIVNPFWCGEIH